MVPQFLNELRSVAPELMAQRWVIDRTPRVFDDDQREYVNWKSKLADGIEVDGRAIAIIGSACIGFSLNPNKNFKAFGPESDIDVAVISSHHFDVAWRSIRSMGPQIHGLNGKQKASVFDHRKRLIFWGTFDTKHLLPKLPFGKQWLEAFETMTAIVPTRDRDINARIYRDFESLSAYHVNNMKKLRDELAEEKD